MADKTVVRTNGISFLGLLAIVFITLKLTAVIDWSWWLVLLPIYGPLALWLGFMIFCIIVVGVFAWLFDE